MSSTSKSSFNCVLTLFALFIKDKINTYVI